MNKRGQVTVFIIVGVLIVLTVISLFYFTSISEKKELTSSKEQLLSRTSLGMEVFSFVENCIDKTSKEAIIFIGKQGGYYNLPQLKNDIFYLPYCLYENQSYFISEEELSNQLESYVKNELPFCLRNFNHFKSKGYNIEENNLTVNVRLGENKIIFDVSYPIFVSKDLSIREMAQFRIEINSRLKVIYQAIDKYMYQQLEFPNSMCISCLIEVAVENDLKVWISPLNDRKMMIKFIDELVPLNDENYEFIFLNDYQFNSEEGLEE